MFYYLYMNPNCTLAGLLRWAKENNSIKLIGNILSAGDDALYIYNLDFFSCIHIQFIFLYKLSNVQQGNVKNTNNLQWEKAQELGIFDISKILVKFFILSFLYLRLRIYRNTLVVTVVRYFHGHNFCANKFNTIQIITEIWTEKNYLNCHHNAFIIKKWKWCIILVHMQTLLYARVFLALAR